MTIQLKVLGTGCSKCKTLEKAVQEVVKENGFDVAVEKVEDMMQIMGYHVMSTPALVANEKVVFSGKVPSKADLKIYIEKAINEQKG